MANGKRTRPEQDLPVPLIGFLDSFFVGPALDGGPGIGIAGGRHLLFQGRSPRRTARNPALGPSWDALAEEMPGT